MEKKKRIGEILFIVVCAIIICLCFVSFILLNKREKELQKEWEKLEMLTVKTKSGLEVETDYIHFGDSQFYIKVPLNFRQLSLEEVNTKYQGDVPDIVYSNDNATINVAISLTDNTMTNDQIKEYQKSLEGLLKSNAKILEENYYEVDGHNVGEIQLISDGIDTSIYNHMMFFSYHNKLVIVAFNCTEALQDEWQNVGNFIIQSLFFID